jgi:hypothetical protein
MKSNTRIVHGGGWVKRRFIGKPKALIFTYISVVWLVIAICASIPLWFEGPFSRLVWLSICLIALEPVFVVAALVFWLIEPPRPVTYCRSNPDYDERNFY